MTHKFNPFPKYSEKNHKSKVFKSVMLIIIAAVSTGYIFYLSMYKTQADKFINEIKESLNVESPPEIQVVTPTKPELIDLTLVDSDLSAIENNLKTLDSLDNL